MNVFLYKVNPTKSYIMYNNMINLFFGCFLSEDKSEQNQLSHLKYQCIRTINSLLMHYGDIKTDVSTLNPSNNNKRVCELLCSHINNPETSFNSDELNYLPTELCEQIFIMFDIINETDVNYSNKYLAKLHLDKLLLNNYFSHNNIESKTFINRYGINDGSDTWYQDYLSKDIKLEDIRSMINHLKPANDLKLNITLFESLNKLYNNTKYAFIYRNIIFCIYDNMRYMKLDFTMTNYFNTHFINQKFDKRCCNEVERKYPILHKIIIDAVHIFDSNYQLDAHDRNNINYYRYLCTYLFRPIYDRWCNDCKLYSRHIREFDNIINNDELQFIPTVKFNEYVDNITHDFDMTVRLIMYLRRLTYIYDHDNSMPDMT
jgi:hypothetical protein